MKQPSVLCNFSKDSNQAQRIFIQATAAHSFFQNFIGSIYGYTMMGVGLGIVKGIIPDMLIDDANVTVTTHIDGQPVSLVQLHRQLREHTTAVCGTTVFAHPISMEDPTFHAQRKVMAEAWGVPEQFCNTYVNALARGVDARFLVSETTRQAVVASAAYSAHQYLSAMLPAYVDHYATVEEFVDVFMTAAKDGEIDRKTATWPVVFNHALLKTLFVNPEFGDAMELYRMYSNLVNNAQQQGDAMADAEMLKNALIYMALSKAV